MGQSLEDFAKTDRQREILALSETMSNRAIASRLGLSRGTISAHLMAVRAHAAKHGYSPEHDMTRSCPETHYNRGNSTLYDAEGKVKLQWVKTAADQDRLRLFAEEMAASICQTVKPAKRKKIGRRKFDDTLAVYPIGDAHVGLYCWSGDAEEDYDCDLATRLMTAGFDRVMAATPNSEQALVVNLGDWLHTDTSENVTRAARNTLDVDTRWSRVVRVGVSILKHLIDRALERHKRVHVINEIGNHDDQTALFLSLLCESHYANEPRVTVDTSPDVFHWYEFGSNLVGVHHGHKCKPERLYQVMHEDRREACGRCRHRYWYIGHVHHSRKMDVGGVSVESFRTLIPRDNYAHSNGYRSPRDICSIVLDREHGECQRATVNVEALR